MNVTSIGSFYQVRYFEQKSTVEKTRLTETSNVPKLDYISTLFSLFKGTDKYTAEANGVNNTISETQSISPEIHNHITSIEEELKNGVSHTKYTIDNAVTVSTLPNTPSHPQDGILSRPELLAFWTERKLTLYAHLGVVALASACFILTSGLSVGIVITGLAASALLLYRAKEAEKQISLWQDPLDKILQNRLYLKNLGFEKIYQSNIETKGTLSKNELKLLCLNWLGEKIKPVRNDCSDEQYAEFRKVMDIIHNDPLLVIYLPVSIIVLLKKLNPVNSLEGDRHNFSQNIGTEMYDFIERAKAALLQPA